MGSKGFALGGGPGGSAPWPSFLEPVGFGEDVLDGLPYLGGPLRFRRVRVCPGGEILGVGDVPARWRGQLAALTAPRPRWAGLPLDRPAVMGILNVTPDSFSDGGLHADPVAAGRALLAAGSDLLDIGGESTRPGSAPVSDEIEQARVLPVVEALSGAVLSVDTRRAGTMAAVLAAGAAIINDISALRHDPAAAALLAARDCPVILMHMRGTPATMDSLAVYDDVVAEVRAELAALMEAAEAAGIDRSRIALDPGFGFAKNGAQNVALLRRLPALAGLGRPLVVGVSRKRFIGTLGGGATPRERVSGSVAAALYAARAGAAVLRVHDVGETVQALRVWAGIAAPDGMD